MAFETTASTPRTRLLSAEGECSRLARRAAGPLAAITAVLLLWQMAALFELIAARQYIPLATDIASRFFALAVDAPLWSALLKTMAGVAGGLAIAIGVGLPAGILIGSIQWLGWCSKIPVEFLRPVPSVALIPLAILIYGNGFESKVFLVAYAALWPILIQTIYGIRDVDPIATDTARAFNCGPVRRVLNVTLPSALPHTVTGVRIASGIAVMLAVTAELIIGMPGLGKEISLARQVGDVTSVYALIVATGLLGWGINQILLSIERRLLFWRPA